MEDAVKVNVYLKNIDDLAAVEDVCARYFTGTPAFQRRRHRCAAHGRVRADRRHLRQRRGHPADQVARLSIG